MDKLKEVIRLIGTDVYKLSNSQKNFLSLNKAYSLFPTFAGLQNQTSRLATKNDLEELKRNVEANDTDLKGEGFPYDLKADIGTTYVDTAAKNGAYKWIKKQAGTGWKTWAILAGDTGSVRPNTIQSNLDNAYIELRRINSTVEITFGGLKWGWFGIKRRGAEGYYPQSSDKERNVTILPIGALPLGFRPTGSKIGIMMNDKGQRYGTWYVGGSSDKNHVRLQFDDPVPTDQDITDIRFTNMTYTTDDPWPETL